MCARKKSESKRKICQTDRVCLNTFQSHKCTSCSRDVETILSRSIDNFWLTTSSFLAECHKSGWEKFPNSSVFSAVHPQNWVNQKLRFSFHFWVNSVWFIEYFVWKFRIDCYRPNQLLIFNRHVLLMYLRLNTARVHPVGLFKWTLNTLISFCICVCI